MFSNCLIYRVQWFCLKKSCIFSLKIFAQSNFLPLLCTRFRHWSAVHDASDPCNSGNPFFEKPFSFGFCLSKNFLKKVAKNFGRLKICLTFALAFGTARQWLRNADDPWQHSIQTKQYNVSLWFLKNRMQSITSKELFNNRQSFIYNDTILLMIKKKDNPKPTTNQTKYTFKV